MTKMTIEPRSVNIMTECPAYDVGPALPELPDFDNPKPYWYSQDPPPPIGSRVLVTFNNLGLATVRAYFTEHCYLGVEVELDQPPDWWLKSTTTAYVFGPEIRLET
jgi:hypothetical protein